MKFPVITIASVCIALALSACGKQQQQEEEPSVSSPVSSVSPPESTPESPPAAQPASPSVASAPEATPVSPTAAAPEVPKPQESVPAKPAAVEKKAPAEQVATSSPAKSEGSSDALALAQKSGCLACHSVEKKVVGPAWKDVSAKYKGDAEAKARLIAKVKAGGKGNWTEVTGGVPMPPYSPRVSDADIETLVTFVLSLAK